MTKRHRTPKIIKPQASKRPSDVGLDYLFTGKIGGSKARDGRRVQYLRIMDKKYLKNI